MKKSNTEDLQGLLNSNETTEIKIPGGSPVIENKKDFLIRLGKEFLSNPDYLISVAASVFADAYYWVTTKGASWYNISSGLSSNFFVNLFAAYNSIAHVRDLVSKINDPEQKDKKVTNIAYLVVTILVATAWSLPYGFISYHESTSENNGGKVFEAVASVLGGLVINLLSLKYVNDEWNGIKDYFAQRALEQKNMITNIDTLTQLESVLNYSIISSHDLKMLKDSTDPTLKALLAFNFIFMNAKSAPAPRWVTTPMLLNKLAQGLTGLIKLVFALTPLYSALAVACATDLSLQKDPPFYMSSYVGVALGNFFLLGEDFLSVVGGLGVASAFISLISNLIQYGKFNNSLDTRTVISTFIALTLAAFSGFTAEKQQEQCGNSLMHYFMMFWYANLLANVSSAFFNFIFAEKCVKKVLNEVLGRLHDEQEPAPCEVIKEAISVNLLEANMLSGKAGASLSSNQLAANTMLKTLQQNPAQFREALFSTQQRSNRDDGSVASLCTVAHGGDYGTSGAEPAH